MRYATALRCAAYSTPVGCSTSRLYAGDVPRAIEFRSSIPTEFVVGNEGVMKRVSAGHAAKDAPTVDRSMTPKFVMPACLSATATPTPAAPAPITRTSYSGPVFALFVFALVCSLKGHLRSHLLSCWKVTGWIAQSTRHVALCRPDD